MSAARATTAPIRHSDRFFIGGEWVEPSSGATIDVIDSGTEEPYYTIAEAARDDVSRAVAAARRAFDEGPWPRLTHAERAEYIRALGEGLQERNDVLGQLWPRESGVLYKTSQYAGRIGAGALASYAALADTFPFEEECPPTTGGEFGFLVREPVGVVGAIIPWNAPVALICHKIGPALLAGCTVVLKSSPEAPGEGYVFAEVAEQIGLPPGVLNVLTADREVSELLVRDPGVDKITFTGSTAAGRRIAALCGERIARCTLELGGKSAAVILDDMDLGTAAKTLARAECGLNGQVCSSLTRVIVTKHRHDEFVDASLPTFGKSASVTRSTSSRSSARSSRNVSGTGSSVTSPKASTRVRSSRPAAVVPTDLDRGYYVAPTVFGNVDNSSTIAREEIFGPVLTVIPAADEQDAVNIANDTIYGLNASVFTNDVDRARHVAGDCARERSATTPSAPTSACRSAASSSRGSAVKAARKGCCRSSRPRP